MIVEDINGVRMVESINGCGWTGEFSI